MQGEVSGPWLSSNRLYIGVVFARCDASAAWGKGCPQAACNLQCGDQDLSGLFGRSQAALLAQEQ